MSFRAAAFGEPSWLGGRYLQTAGGFAPAGSASRVMASRMASDAPQTRRPSDMAFTRRIVIACRRIGKETFIDWFEFTAEASYSSIFRRCKRIHRSEERRVGKEC